MFRLWGKLFKDTHLLKDIVISNDDISLNRTKKIFNAIDDICNEFDLSKPIWLDANVSEFQCYSKTRFTQDNFIEQLDFDFLEIHVIEED